jgi:flagellar hook-associated protein 2
MSSGITISGAVSGLDTASLINQLVQVQQNQQTMLQSQQTKVQKTSDAYGSLITQLNTLSSLTSDLQKTSTWQGTTATSTASSVTATATSNVASSITFDVTSVAQAHTLISAESVGSLNTVVANGPLTLTRQDGSTASIDVGTGSLSDVAAAINNAGVGLTAAAVQTAVGEYRLQVASTATGSSSAFSLDGVTGFTGMNVLTQGTDAVVHVGTDPNTGYDATSSTNTFASLVPGISFTVSKQGETGVTVSSTLDGSAVATKIQKMVDSANSVLTYINQQTAYDTTTKTGGALLGESAVRSLQQNVLSAVSTAGAAGVHLTRDGTLTFDQAEFTKAYKADPNAVAAAFGAKGSFTAAAGLTGTSVTYSGSTDATRPGTYEVAVTRAPERESWSLAPSGGTVGTITVSRGSTSITYTNSGFDTVADTVNTLNQQSASAGLGITASVDNNGVIHLTADAYGTAAAFTATIEGNAGTRDTAGADVAGTIGGMAATGIGDVLSVTTGTGSAVGLSLKVGTTAADIATSGGVLGTMTYTPGLAQRLSTLVRDATNSTTGALTTAKQSQQTEIKTLQDQIDAWNDRLTAYRETLTRQFTVMETTLAQLKSSMSAISGLTTSSSSSNGSSTSTSG